MKVTKYNYLIYYFAPIFVSIIGIKMYWIAIFGENLSFIPGDWGDGRFNNYILEHGYLYLTMQVKTFWNAPFMFPMQNVIAMSDNLLGSMPFYAFFRFIGIDLETSYQYWIILITFFNFICAYWVLYRWTQNIFAALLGAYFFTFAVATNNQIHHIQVLPRFIMPIAFHHAFAWLQSANKINFLYFSLAVVYQFYCAIYLGFLLIFILFFLVIAWLILLDKTSFLKEIKNKKNLLQHTLFLLISITFMSFLMFPYLKIKEVLPSDYRAWNDVIKTIPTIQSYFFSSEEHKLYSFLSFHYKNDPIWWDKRLFLGVFPLFFTFIVTPIILLKYKSNESKTLFFWFLILVFTLLFSLKFGNFSLYYIFFKYIPGFSALGTITRVIFPILFLFSIIISFSFTLFTNQFPKYANIIGVLALVLMYIDQYGNYNYEFNSKLKQESYIMTDSLVTKINENKKPHHNCFAWFATKEGDDFVKIHNQAMIASQKAHFPCVNGYSSGCLAEFCDFSIKHDSISLVRWLNANEMSIENVLILK